MENKVTALAGQTLADIAVQETGTLESIFDLAMANNGGITDIPLPGAKLVVPETTAKVREIANYYRARNIRPVTRIEVESGTVDQDLFEDGLFYPGLFD